MARRIFFWFLVLAFFVITPTLIGYALGYRYNFDRGIFVFAGSVTIKANPERVSIDINGQPATNRKMNFLNGSYHIDGLKPGEYTVRVFQDNFQDWKKTIQVQSGISTEFWNVLLPRTDYAETLYAGTDSALRFFPAPKNALFAVARKDANIDSSLRITLTDTDANISKEIYSSDTVKLTEDTLQNIEWSPKEDFLLVPIQAKKETSPSRNEKSEWKNDSLIVPVDTATNPVFLSTLLPADFSASHARWSPEEKDVLYFLHNESLWKINISEKTNPLLIAENILGYDFYTNHIIVLRKENHILYKYSLDINDDPVQVSTAPLSEGNNNPHRLIAYDDTKIALINDQGELFIYNNYKNEIYTRKLASPVTGAQFSNDGKKLLFWNDREVFVYFVEEWKPQPQRTKDTLIQIARFYTPITNVQWIKDYEHILYNQGRDIKILDLDARGGQNGFILKTLTSTNPNIFSSSRDDKIYYTDTKDVASQFFSIDFPEKTTFFGF